jgi:transposase
MEKPRAKRTRTPKHNTVVRAFVFPIETNKLQSEKLFGVKDLCWEAREYLVAERTKNRHENQMRRAAGEPVKYLTRAEQYVQVALLARDDRRFAAVHSQVLQNVAHRVDEGTKRWFDARRNGRKNVNPPGPILRKDYHSFTYPQYGISAHVKSGRLHLSKLGEFRLLDYRKMRGQPKTVTIKFEDGRWWAVITCALQAKDVIRSAETVSDLPDIGGDPGLGSLLTLADGTKFDPPRALKDALGQLRHEQRNMSRKFRVRESQYEEKQKCLKAAGEQPLPPLREIPYSNRLKAQVRRVAKLYTKVKNTREHHHCKIAARIEKTYRYVALEEHGVKFMFANRRQARSAADRGIAAMKQRVVHKLGPRCQKTPNQRPDIGGNSQTCLCGESVPKTLKDRIHECLKCGLKDDRDVVSANIVMSIAFGWSLLDHRIDSEVQASAGSWQELDRRGETEGGAGLVPVGSAKAAEVSVRRPPQATLDRSTEGAEATSAAKNFAHRQRNLSLPDAAKKCGLSALLNPGSTVPSGR